MRTIGVLGATAAAVVLLAYSPVAGFAVQKETETVDRTVPFPEGGTIRLENFSGDVTVTGTSGHDVVIHAVRYAERRKLDNIHLVIASSGSRVSIDANGKDAGHREEKDNVVQTTFEIQVPAEAKLDFEVFSSGLVVRDVKGEQHLKTFSGDIDVAGARDRLDLHTFSGRIDVDARAAGAEPRIEAQTFSAPIHVRLDPAATGSVRFNSFSGSIDSDRALVVHASGRRNLEGELSPEGSRGSLRFSTFSGDVRLEH